MTQLLTQRPMVCWRLFGWLSQWEIHHCGRIFLEMFGGFLSGHLKQIQQKSTKIPKNLQTIHQKSPNPSFIKDLHPFVLKSRWAFGPPWREVFGILIVMELQANIPHGSVSSQTIALMTAVYSFYLLRGFWMGGRNVSRNVRECWGVNFTKMES